MSFIHILARWAAYILLGLVSVAMVFLPKMLELFAWISHDKITLALVALGIALFALDVFIVHFDLRLKEIVSSREAMKHESLAEALQDAFHRKRYHVKELRVFALTSEEIYSIIMGIPCHIHTCKIMLHRFPECGSVKEPGTSRRQVEHVKSEWAALQNAGRIRHLSIVLYDDYPHEYSVILDGDALVAGLFDRNEDMPHGADFIEPCSIFNVTIPAATTIQKHVQWFDALFNHWKAQGDDRTMTIVTPSRKGGVRQVLLRAFSSASANDEACSQPQMASRTDA